MEKTTIEITRSRCGHTLAIIQSVDVIQCGNCGKKSPVIEHLLDVKPAFCEILRILHTAGIFVGDSRNWFDIFFPKPHVHLRGVGFLPRKVALWYVMAITQIPGYYMLELKNTAQSVFMKTISGSIARD